MDTDRVLQLSCLLLNRGSFKRTLIYANPHTLEECSGAICLLRLTAAGVHEARSRGRTYPLTDGRSRNMGCARPPYC